MPMSAASHRPRRLPFPPSPRPLTLGVELELQLVGRDGMLLSAAPAVLDELHRRFPGDEERYQKELLQNTVETTTPVASTVPAMRGALRLQLGRILDTGAPHGATLLSAGSHPLGDPWAQPVTEHPRIRLLVDQIGSPVRELSTYGLHVHVGVSNGDEAIDVSNVLLHHLPQVLALSASSPFWDGKDTGLASRRCPAFRSLPVTGIPPEMRGWVDWQSHFFELWDSRQIGVFRDEPGYTLTDAVKDIHYDVRPTSRGTVELRIADAPPTLREVAAITAYVQCLAAVAQSDPALVRPLPRSVLEANKDATVRDGVDARVVDLDGRQRPVWYLIERDVERLRPVARRLGCANELEDVLRIVHDWGPSHQRQRAVYADTPAGRWRSETLGMPSLGQVSARGLRAVVESLNRELLTDAPVVTPTLTAQLRAARAVRGRERVTLLAGDTLRRSQSRRKPDEQLALFPTSALTLG